MKRLFPSVFIILIISFFMQTCIYAGRIELKFFSSRTGYTVSPEYVSLTRAEDYLTAIRLNKNSNTYFTELSPGTYLINAATPGYENSQTSFTINDNEISYDIFLDPLTPDPKLVPARIKSLLKPDAALLLGYAVDDVTGQPLANVKVMEGASHILAQTDANGYFEITIPAQCENRATIDLSFEKAPYNVKQYQSFEITPNTDFIFSVRMLTGGSLNKYAPFGDKCEECTSPGLFNNMAVTGFVVPLNIRVGKNCTGTSCTSAQVYSLQTYCKYVLPAEIYACWGNISGGMNSLQACAVAVRTYGMYYVYNPINASLYDICDNTYCQYMGSVTSTNTNTAVDNTFAYILTNSSGVVRSEYSAENNNKGCGNGYSGTGSAWPCIYDPVCTGGTPNGHGRGLCQWGTVRWATGRLVTTSSPCSQGNAHSYGSKTWQEILTHYYSVSPINWSVTLGTTASINSSTAVPSNTGPCAQITISSNVTSSGTASLMIGASIAPTGTTNWISDATGDVKKTFTQGTANYTRTFKIPCNTANGTYDMFTALWYDKNNNNTIDGGDFVVNSKITTAALTVSPNGITVISSEIPDKFDLLPNYPNPFNPTTKINFDIPSAGQRYAFDTKLVVYDISGRVVATLVNGQLQPGSYSVEWDGTGFASGVYFYSLITNEFTETKRMVLVK
jgi:hypothetical protein